MEHTENQGAADDGAGVAPEPGLGQRIYDRHMDVPCVTRWTPGTGGPGSILRFGMDRFSLADSIQRRWAGGSPFAYERASLQHVVVAGVRRRTVFPRAASTGVVARVIEGPQVFEKSEESPAGIGGSTSPDSGTVSVQAKAVPTLAQNAPNPPVTSADEIHRANSLSDASQSTGVGSQPKTIVARVDSSVVPSNSPAETVVWGPIIRQRPRGSIQLARNPVTSSSSPPFTSNLLPGVTRDATSDSTQSALSGTTQLSTKSTNANASLVTSSSSQAVNSGMHSRDVALPSAILRQPGLSTPPSQPGILASHASEIEHESVKPPKTSPASNAASIMAEPTRSRDINARRSSDPLRLPLDHPATTEVVRTANGGTEPKSMILRKSHETEHRTDPPSQGDAPNGSTFSALQRKSVTDAAAQSHPESPITVGSSEPVSPVLPSAASFSESLDRGVATSSVHAEPPATAFTEIRLQHLAHPSGLTTRTELPSRDSIISPPLDRHPSAHTSAGNSGQSQQSSMLSADDNTVVIGHGPETLVTSGPAILQRSAVAPATDIHNNADSEALNHAAAPALTHSRFISRADSSYTGSVPRSGSDRIVAATDTAPSMANSAIAARPTDLDVSAVSLAHASRYTPVVGSQVQRSFARKHTTLPANHLPSWNYPTRISSEDHTPVLTHRALPLVQAHSMPTHDGQRSSHVRDFQPTIQRSATQEGGTQSASMPAPQAVSLPEQGGALSRTQPAVDVTSLANRVYDLLLRRLSSERQRRGL